MKEHISRDIRAAAARLFREKGYSKVPMREIAGEAHVGLSNIYNYYSGKDEIFRSIVAPVVDNFERLLDSRHGRAGTDIMEMFSDGYLRGVVEEYVSAVSRHRDLIYLLLFRSQGSSLENFREDYADRSTKTVRAYFLRMKRRHPHINVDVSDFTIHLHTVWMFTMLEEMIMHDTGPEETEKIITEYMIFCTTGWRELIAG